MQVGGTLQRTMGTAIPKVVRIFLVVMVTVDVVSCQLCNRYAPHYSLLATHNAPGPWEASLDVTRHTLSPRLHFTVRPTSTGLADKLTVTLKGRLPVGELEAVDDGYEEVEVTGAGSRWYKVHAARVTWAEAKAVCEAGGAHLVLVDSLEEAAALGGLLARHVHSVSHELHAGFFAKDYADSFYTVDGKPLSASGYDGWGPGQPDMSICGRIDLQGLLRDGMCEWVEPVSFVCEREPGASPAGAVPAASFTGPAPAPPPAATPPLASAGYGPVRPHGGDSLYKLHTAPATWWEAEAICEEEGARLVVLNSREEANVVKELTRRAEDMVLQYVYVGARAELNLVTVFGKSLTDTPYNIWATGHPAFNNCVVASHNGTLWVTQCWAKYPFLCEYYTP